LNTYLPDSRFAGAAFPSLHSHKTFCSGLWPSDSIRDINDVRPATRSPFAFFLSFDDFSRSPLRFLSRPLRMEIGALNFQVCLAVHLLLKMHEPFSLTIRAVSRRWLSLPTPDGTPFFFWHVTFRFSCSSYRDSGLSLGFRRACHKLVTMMRQPPVSLPSNCFSFPEKSCVLP